MKKIIKRIFMTRIISVLLCVVALGSLVSIAVAAENASSKVTVLPKRFCTNEIMVYNAVPYKNDDGTVKLSFDGKQPKISMDIVPLKAETEANALRVVLKNESTIENVSFDYIYKDHNGINKSGATYMDVERSSDAMEYIVSLPEADELVSLLLSFGSGDVSSGEITMISIGAVSYCFDEREYVGALLSNEYNRETGKAKFYGSVSYETTLANPGGKIVLYKLSPNEKIEDVSFVHPYIATSPITLNFKFDFKVENISDACARYFAAVLTDNNEILPLTAETYLQEVSMPDVSDQKDEVGFKGIETQFYAGAAENGTSVAFVDVYLNRLKNKHGDGFQYILGDGKEYYFDKNYIAELDAEIKSYEMVGASVYLRLLIDAYDSAFVCHEWNDTLKSVKYFSVDTRNDETLNNFYACADFIVSRYTGGEFSALQGLILGRSLDTAYQYNYCGTVPLAEYADLLARTYVILKQVAKKSGNDLEIVLPVSGIVENTGTLVTVDSRDKNYPLAMLSNCVLSMIDRYGFDVESLYFMIENESTSAVLEDDCVSFLNMVSSLSDRHEGLPSEILYSWIPDSKLSSGETVAHYIYNYNLLACIGGVRSYVVSIFEKSTNSLSLENSIFNVLKNAYKYADTYNNSKFGESALSYFEGDSWEDIFPTYSEKHIVKRTLVETNLLQSLPSNVTSSYCMWDFSKANGTLGWSAADGCSSLSVYSPSKELSRALAIAFDSDTMSRFGADYGSVIYNSSDLAVKDILGLSFDVLIYSASNKDNKDGVFEIKMVFGSGNEILEASGVIKENYRTSVYADISSMDQIDYIKISLRSLEGEMPSNTELLINSISIHSDLYSDKELEDIVVSGKIIGEEESFEMMVGETTVVFFAVIGFGLIAVLICWLVFVLIQTKRES